MSLPDRLESQIPDPLVLTPMFLESNFLRFSLPICEIRIVTYIERCCYKGTKQALPPEGSSVEDCGILYLPVWLSGTNDRMPLVFSRNGKIWYIHLGKCWHFIPIYRKNMHSFVFSIIK